MLHDHTQKPPRFPSTAQPLRCCGRCAASSVARTRPYLANGRTAVNTDRKMTPIGFDVTPLAI